jgi:hypothetical protein
MRDADRELKELRDLGIDLDPATERAFRAVLDEENAAEPMSVPKKSTKPPLKQLRR